MGMMPRLSLSFLFAPFCLFHSALAQDSASLLKPHDRVVFIGDSITGQGANAASGWAHLIDQALKTVHPDWSLTFISLGGSGQTVGSWQNVEKKSRDQAVVLDVKTVDVKATLDQPADVVICMLGMNDTLRPSLKNQPEDIAKWASQYRDLIASIRARTHPRVFALATPTMCTEDPGSPKNQMMAALIAQLRQLAPAEHCAILPTYDTMREVLDAGRAWKPDFHVLGDGVHPNAAGHYAIAAGMLRGLGEQVAADNLLAKQAAALPKAPALSYSVSRLISAEPGEEQFRIRYFCHPAPGAASSPATLSLPSGWKIISSRTAQPEGDFIVQGSPDHLENRFTLNADRQTASIVIPAPWLIGTIDLGGAGWATANFDPTKKPVAADTSLSRGDGFSAPQELAPGKTIAWKTYFPTVDYGGAGAPGAIDLSALTFYQNFTIAYGARWINAPDARSIGLKIRRLGFSPGSYLTVWLNGQQIYAGQLKAAPDTSLPLDLHPGWNALVFKSNHYQTQWQFALDLEGGQLDGLKFSITSPPSATASR